jgi:WD40 repeat protein
VRTGKLLNTIPHRLGDWDDTTLSPRGTYVAVEYQEQAGGPSILEFWDAATGQLVGTPMRHYPPIQGFAFSPDEKTLLTLADGVDGFGQLRLWDVATHRLLALGPVPCSGHRPCFAPDGNSFAVILNYGVKSWDHNSAVQFWDTTTLRSIGPPREFPAGINPGRHTLAFHPRGEMVAITTDDGAALVPAPRRVQQDATRLRLWVEVATGLELDEYGAVVELDAKTWRERWERLQKLGGPPLGTLP